ncbi:BMC domain-containing protein [Virgibacillus byunsanensis]|uniref:BMC domain-containing protein n=1 Tax=Virgibacillus byunsanensis TaxID=570945 RepID=A0ABW3LPG4_9BACI
MSAIGLVETRGLTAAIEALDSMAKAANIRLVDMKRVGSGLITVIVEGNVSDVSYAIEIGKLAHERAGGELISYSVIPRPHSELKKIL